MKDNLKKIRGRPVTKENYKYIKSLCEDRNLTPKLVVIAVGKDPAAEYYVNNIAKKGKKVEIQVEIERYPEKCSQTKILQRITDLNSNDSVHGIMIQKPLPKHINDEIITTAINPNKDVDGFHPLNIGKLVLDQPGLLPCTPAAVLELIKFYKIKTDGKKVVVLGRSDIVGKPLMNLLIRKNQTGNATVTICHSHTKNLKDETKKADIIIAAVGKAEFLTKNMIKDGAIIIDVGINKKNSEKGETKYVGDVDYKNCMSKAKLITPVPGGVGSVTTSILLKNVTKSCLKMQNEK